MKLEQIVNPIFLASLNTLAEARIPAKAAYNLKKTIDLVQGEAKRCEEFRNGLVIKYAEKGKDGEPKKNESGQVTVAAENIEEFQKQYADLISTEVEVRQISVESLGIELKISAKELMALDPILVN